MLRSTAVVLLGATMIAWLLSNSGRAEDKRWLKLLEAPRSPQRNVPSDWPLKPTPRKPVTEGPGGASGGALDLPETADELMRASPIVAVGVGAGSDGSFVAPGSGLQFTTYYLRVEGYLKDVTGRRGSFLRILAPGGFLKGGQHQDAALPYILPGKRYLVYLTPNHGIRWGYAGTSATYVGTPEDYWTTGRDNGLWWDRDGQLVGSLDAATHWGIQDPATKYPAFAEGIGRAHAARQREIRRLPPLPKRIPFTNPD